MIISRFLNMPELAWAAADRITGLITATLAKKNTVAIGLSGGNSPRQTYAALADSPFRERIPWGACRIFLVDERFTSCTGPESNFRMIHDALLKKVPIPAENIFPIPVDTASAELAAGSYEKKLKKNYAGRPFPDLDLIILGMGADGHIASLFPGSSALSEKKRWVIPTIAPIGAPARERVTLTLPVLNHAHSVIFIISGAGKNQIIEEISADPERASGKYPAALISPAAINTIFIDQMTNFTNI